MTTIRRDGPTPAGGDFVILTFVDLATMAEVDESLATGVAIAEYTDAGALLRETVGEVDRAGA